MTRVPTIPYLPDETSDDLLNMTESEELADFKQSFAIFDKNKDGTISLQEVMDTFTELQLPLDTEEAKELIAEFDDNSDGEIEFSEFVNFMKKYVNAHETGSAAMFQYFDMDGDGAISIDEMLLAMRFLGEDISNQDADRLFAKYYKIDKTGHKTITKKDFQEIMNKYHWDD